MKGTQRRDRISQLKLQRDNAVEKVFCEALADLQQYEDGKRLIEIYTRSVKLWRQCSTAWEKGTLTCSCTCTLPLVRKLNGEIEKLQDCIKVCRQLPKLDQMNAYWQDDASNVREVVGQLKMIKEKSFFFLKDAVLKRINPYDVFVDDDWELFKKALLRKSVSFVA